MMESTEISCEKQSIADFYSRRDVFITGGTGFIGKVLIEKLLRSCPAINKIFILVRPKRGKSIEERLEAILKLPLFDVIRNERPAAFFKKLIPINGDCSVLDMGLGERDRLLMNDVSVIFHSAACVRFDDDFKSAILLNTRGTRDVLEFALTLKKIKVILHISTTYCNPDHRTVEETIYPAKDNWRNAIKCAENFDLDLLNAIQQKYTKLSPNTYTYTKGLAEQIINDYNDRLPLVIYRPSIVISSLNDPIPGWVDNLNGPVALIIGCGVGILRTSYADPTVVSDFTPVDISVKGMIVAAYACGLKEEKVELPIYNCSTSLQRGFTNEYILNMGKSIMNDYPLKQMIWKPGGRITRCKYDNYIKFILVQLLPACLLDIALRCSGNKPILVKLQRKIYGANEALQYFIRNSWTFKNAKFLKLHDSIKLSDIKQFGFNHFLTVDVRDYFINCVYYGRLYLLKEPPENLPEARLRYKRIDFMDAFLRIFFQIFLFYLIFFKWFNILQISPNLWNAGDYDGLQNN